MSHAPKQAALEAHAAELLSPAGRARVERHLAGCSVCRETLAAIRAYTSLRQDAELESLPELSWDRLSKALDKPLPTPAASTSSKGRTIALVWPLLAVAATLLIAWIGLSGGTTPSAPLAAKVPPPRAGPAAELPLEGRVTLISGQAFLERGGERTSLTLDSKLAEHSVLVTAPNSELHVVLGGETGFVLSSDSRVHLAELREQGIHIELTLGSLASRVKKLSAEQRYSVATADITAHVRGTRFLVERREGVRVFVHEGTVEITQLGKTLAMLTPGQSFAVPTRSALGPSDRQVHALSLDQGVALQLPPLPSVRAWLVDGAPMSAQGALAMRVPPGPLSLPFQDLRGQVRNLELLIGESGSTLDEVSLARLVAPETRNGHLEPDQISAVVRAGLDPLRRCYERSLKTVPSLAGKLTLVMRVGADGHVVRAEAKGSSELPRELQRCLAQEAGRLRFPRPEGGGELSFEVPLNLKSGG